MTDALSAAIRDYFAGERAEMWMLLVDHHSEQRARGYAAQLEAANRGNVGATGGPSAPSR